MNNLQHNSNTKYRVFHTIIMINIVIHVHMSSIQCLFTLNVVATCRVAKLLFVVFFCFVFLGAKCMSVSVSIMT